MKHGSKSNHKDIILLLCGLLGFSGGISLLYGVSTHIPSTNTLEDQGVVPLEDKDIVRAIQPFEQTGSVGKMADTIAQSPFDQQMRIFNQVLKNQSSVLGPEEKVELGLELLAKRVAAPEQKAVLGAIIAFPGVLKVPLLYIAIEKKQEKTVPKIVRYYQNKEAELQKNIYESLLYALKQDNLKTFARLIEAVGGIPSQMATKLLWDILQEKKDAQYVPVVVAQKADINNVKEGKTPLITAIDTDNVEMVQMLLDKGALPNKFADPAIGTPLQRARAMQKKLNGQNATIELLLRQHGAKE